MSWKLFVLGQDKRPLPNCARCRDTDDTHDREACECLTCHAIYAATDVPWKIDVMRKLHPDHAWAVRTGHASNIIVLDAEGGGDPSGVDVLDGFERWTNGVALQTTGLIASTPSGGVHRYYRWVPGVRSRNRVLPGVDIKSDGGYVVIPFSMYVINEGIVGSVVTPGDDRDWLLNGDPTQPVGDFHGWLVNARGGRSGGGQRHAAPGGYDYHRFARDGCPGGSRDEFFNELLFRMRKAGLDRATATVKAREHWHRVEQPPIAEWYMPWWNVEYKIDKIWRTVPLDEITPQQREWIETITRRDEDVKHGRVTLARR